MHRSVWPAIVAGILSVSTSAQGLANPILRNGGFANGIAPKALFTPDRVIVRFRGAVDDDTVQQFAQAAGVELVDRGLQGTFHVFRCPAELVDTMVRWFAEQPGVEYAERDALAHTTVAPSDTFWSLQWSLFNANSPSGTSVSNYGVRAEAAWTNGATGSNIDVAVAAVWPMRTSARSFRRPTWPAARS